MKRRTNLSCGELSARTEDSLGTMKSRIYAGGTGELRNRACCPSFKNTGDVLYPSWGYWIMEEWVRRAGEIGGGKRGERRHLTSSRGSDGAGPRKRGCQSVVDANAALSKRGFLFSTWSRAHCRWNARLTCVYERRPFQLRFPPSSHPYIHPSACCMCIIQMRLRVVCVYACVHTTCVYTMPVRPATRSPSTTNTARTIVVSATAVYRVFRVIRNFAESSPYTRRKSRVYEELLGGGRTAAAVKCGSVSRLWVIPKLVEVENDFGEAERTSANTLRGTFN